MPSDVLITPASSKIEFTDGANATKTLKITGTSLNTDTSFAIGATTANNTLSVLGSASIGSSYNVAGPTNGLIVQGNVGIGITSPSNTKLHIVGDWVSGHSTVKVQGITDNTTGYGFYDTAGSRLGYLAYTGAAFEWYNNANVPVIFYSNTLERMRIATDGNIGIGTTSPASKLHIYDSTYSFTRCTNTANAGHYVDIGANSAGQSFLFSYGAYPVLLGTNGTERIRILSDGNVGIGTANPATKLEVYGVVRITESASGSILQIQAGSSALDFASTFYGGTYRPFTFTNGGSEKMRIQSDGNVGIGITSPNASLHIKPTTLGANGFILERYASTAKLVYMYESGADGYIEVRSGADVIVSKISGYTSTPTYFQSNVGIGTTSPVYLFAVNAATDVWHAQFGQVGGNQLRIGGNTPYGGVIGAYADNSNGSPRQLLLNRDGGNVAVGASSSNNKLHINGSTSIGSSYNTAGPINGLIVQGNFGTGTTSPDLKVHIDAVNAYPASSGTTPNGYLILRAKTAGGTHGMYLGVANASPFGSWIQCSDSGNLATNYPLLLNPNGGNVGIGNTSPAYKLDVNGTTRLGGIVYNEAVQTDDFNYFNLQPYIESETLSTILSVAGTAPTFVTLTNTTAPFSKVMSVSAYGEAALGDYIPVQAGETIYGEIWAYRDTGAAGAAGVLYCGVMRYDKDKKMIDSNAGLNTAPSGYFIAFNQTIPSNSTWTKYSGTLVLPTSHTPYNTSDGGPVRYIRPYIIYNYTAGTILTYIGGWKIRKVQLTRDSGVVTINGNVGIGTTSPSSQLEVGNVNASGSGITVSARYDQSEAYIRFRTGHPNNSNVWETANISATDGGNYNGTLSFRTSVSSQSSPSTKMTILPNGNIGIGNTSPAYKLDVNGTGNFGQLITGTTFPQLTVNGTTNQHTYVVINRTNYEAGIQFQTSGTSKWWMYMPSGDDTSLRFYSQAGGDLVSIKNAGNVGIGVTSPNNRLHVNGSVSIGSGYNTAAPTNGLIVEGSVGVGKTTIRLNSILDVNGSGCFGTSGYGFYVGTDGTGAFLDAGTQLIRMFAGQVERMRIATDGNIGIGTTSPSSKLHLDDINAPWITISRGGTPTWQLRNNYPNNQYGFSFNNTTAGTVPLFIGAGGNIGLGIDNPSVRLDIASTQANGIVMRYDTTTAYQAWIRPYWNSGTDTRVDFAINRTANVAPDVIMSVGYGSNVGIGTVTPSAKLHIIGSSILSNSTQINPDSYQGAVVAGAVADGSGWGVVGSIGGNGGAAGKSWGIGNSGTDLYFGYQNASANSTMQTFMQVSSSRNLYLVPVSGNVGIGNTNPTSKLQVTGGIQFGYGSDSIFYTGTGFDASNYLILQNNTDSYGRVGLFINAKTFNGANTPSTNDGWSIDPRSGIRFRGWLSGDSGYDTKFVIQHLLANATNAVGDFGIFAKAFSTTIPAFVLAGAGNIGVGTTTPSNKLHIYSSANEPVLIQGTTGGTWLNFQSSTSNLWSIGAINATGFGIYNRTTNANTLFVANNGNIGVGNIYTSNNKLHVDGSMSVGSGYNTAAPTNGLLVQGNVGIGMTTTNYKLNVSTSAAQGFTLITNASTVGGPQIDIYDATRAEETVISSTDGTTVGSYIASYLNHPLLFGAYASVSPTAKMVIATSGNVGIGVINPLAQLHINEATSGAAALRVDGTNGTLFSVVDDLSDSLMSVNNSAGLPVLEVFADDRVVMGQYGQNDFVLRNNKVGIGIANPNNKLHVYNSSGSSTIASNAIAVFEQSSNAGIQVCVPDASEAGLFFSRSGATYYSAITRNGTDLLLKNNSATAVTINSSGNVGIGSTSPVSPLTVYNNSDVWHFRLGGASGELRMGGQTNSGAVIQAYTPGGSVRDLYLQRDGGNVGIGTNSPSRKLHVYSSGLSDNTVNPLLLIDGKFTAAGVDSNDIVGIAFRVENSAGGSQTTTCIGSSYQGTANALLLQPVSGNVGVGTINPSFKFEIGAGTSDVVVAKLTQGYERVRYNGFDLIGYNDGNLWMLGNNAANALILGASWDWDRQIAIVYTPATTGATGGSLEIGQLTKNNANFTHGNTRFYTNGVERLRIISNGYVGIGASSPTYKLQIGTVGSLADSIRIGTYLVAKNTRQYIGYTRDDTGLFESAGDGDTPATVKGGVAGIRIVNTTGTLASAYADNSVQLLTHIFNGGSRVVLHANYDGNVGIGTSVPAALLQIGSGTPTSATGGLQFGDDTGTRLYRSASGIVTCSGSIEISANASLNGNYGTWTGEINKIQWHSNNLYFVNRGGGSWLFRNSSAANVFSIAADGGTSAAANINAGTYVYAGTYLQTNGNLIYPSGYGATLKLEVGNPSSNAWIDGLTLAPGGNVVIAGTLTESSSIRYKENIETISAPILPKLNKIRPVTYNKKDNPKHIEYGIIAEELNELFPEFVNKNEKGEVESVNYSRLTVILIKAVKELQEEVEKLKNK